MTIVEQLEKNVKLFPEKTAIVHKGSRVSYEELYRKSEAMACFLACNDFAKGQKVGLLLRKKPEAIIAFLGVAMAGGIVFPIDYNQHPADIQSILDLTRPFMLLVDADLQPLLSRLRYPCRDENIIVVGEEAGNQHRTWEEILRNDRGAPGVKIREADVVYLNFTSGTTGFPKGAITTHANIYWNTVSSVESLKLTRDDIHLCMFPVFAHPHELFARSLYLGGTVVLLDNISPKAIAKTISDHDVTCMMAVASVYGGLVRLHKTRASRPWSLRLAESGGMHIDTALARAFKERFAIPVVPVWGSTETAGVALASPVDGTPLPGSMGRPCRHYEVRVVGEEGNELGPDEIGEMAIRGPAVCSGYYCNPEETSKHMRDGWFFSGDLVRKDPDNNFHFVGRKARMMKVAGLKVSPIEIEDALNNHPDIFEAAVIKVRNHLTCPL